MNIIIKSPYLFKLILSYIDERTKLRLIKYSNKTQKILNISEINYKLFSGKYITKTKRETSKIYDYYNNLLFEGKYLNGKKNGKCKEYNIYGELLFEGEYLNGKKWNGKGYYVDTIFDKYNINYKIKDYNIGHKIDIPRIFYEIKEGKGYMIDYNDEEYIYEGEYLNGERNGKGRDYKKFRNNLLIYDGEYLNGKRNGIGKEYQANDVESAICGNGTLSFEGEYLNGRKWNGKGYDDNNNEVYEIKNGKGFIKKDCGTELIFEEEFLNGEINGNGKGKGKEDYSKEKIKFEGEYLNGKKHGEGKEYNEKGNLIFQGEYLYNYKTKGKEYYNDGKIKYDGE